MASCTIIGVVVAKDQTREELSRILADQVAPTWAEAGCINYDFHVSEEDPNVFMFYENWRSKARPVEIKFYGMLSRPAERD